MNVEIFEIIGKPYKSKYTDGWCLDIKWRAFGRIEEDTIIKDTKEEIEKVKKGDMLTRRF